jgi:uncharacterized membrane protein
MDPAPARQGPRRLAIWEICLLIAGIAVGFWLWIAADEPAEPPWYPWLMAVLGGMSVVGPPILLWERRRRRSRWGPGEVLWFSSGISAWLLWPPIIAGRVRPQAGPGPGGTAATCFAYGTPLMALYVGSALLFGGWIRRKGRSRRRRLSWRERFGLILGIAWAMTGCYALYRVYTEK